LLTHDVQTMTKYAYERVANNQKMSGVFEVKRNAPLVEVIEDILLVVEASEPEEWANQVRCIPLK